MPQLLEVGAHGATAILATWLGLLVVTRAGRAAGARVFAFLCLLLVAWSVAIVGQRIGSRLDAHPFLNAIEDVSAFLLPAATAHLALFIALEGRTHRWATAFVVGSYVLGVLAGLQAILDPDHPIMPRPDGFAPLGLTPDTVGWAFIAVRAAIFATALGWLLVGLRSAGEDRARQRQLQVALATVALGVVGGMARILPEEIGGPRWVGVSLVAAATVLAAYAVLAQRVFLGAEVATRAFRYTLILGVGVIAYVGLLVAVDRAAAASLGIDLPIVTALAIVVTIALFEPAADAVRAALSPTALDHARARLLRALGADTLVGPQPAEWVEPALARLVRTFRLSGATLTDADGQLLGAHGRVDPDDPLGVRMAVRSDGVAHGVARFGRKESGLPFNADELGLLELAAEYLGASLRLGERREQQATSLASLTAEGDAVVERGSALSGALAEASTPARGLRVYALGALRAERDGQLVRQWGGEKAGSRQAEGVFAFLFDRGERGASKDEIVELVWPDVDLDRADVAFHRTLLGLRSMLQPERGGQGSGRAVTFHNDRYRLSEGVVTWSDVAEFELAMTRAREAVDDDERLRRMEAARALYRGDYLDDCPFYGDGAAVEERRVLLRQRYVDLLVDLGRAYAAHGDRAAAADVLRRAQLASDRDVPAAREALAVLGSQPVG